jgi:hypothetical protein
MRVSIEMRIDKFLCAHYAIIGKIAVTIQVAADGMSPTT